MVDLTYLYAEWWITVIDVEIVCESKYWFEGNKLLFWATGLAQPHASEKEIEKVFQQSKGMKILYRHDHNVEGGDVFGYVKEAKMEDGKIKILVAIDGDTEEDKRLQNEIVGSIQLSKEGIVDKPYGFSARFVTRHREDDPDRKDPVKTHLEEYSVTPIPKCNDCTIELEDDKMPDDKPNGAFDTLKKREKELEEKVAVKNEAIKEINSKYVETLTDQEVLLTEHEKIIKTAKELEDRAAKAEAETKALQKKIVYLEESKPLLDKLAKFETSETLLETMKDLSKEKLEKILEEKEKASTQTPSVEKADASAIVTTTVVENEKEAQEEAKKAEQTLEQLAGTRYQKIKQRTEKKMKAHGVKDLGD